MPLWREAHFQVKIKHTSAGSLLESCDSKKCTPWWREAHFEDNMVKTRKIRTTFRSCDVEKVHAVVGANTFRKQTMFGPLIEVQISKSARCGAKHISKLKCIKPCSDHFWRFRCRFASLHYTLYITLHYTPPHYITHSTLQQYTK